MGALGARRICETIMRDRRESLYMRRILGITRHEYVNVERISLRMSQVRVFKTVLGILDGAKGGGVRWNFGRRHSWEVGSQTTSVFVFSKTGGGVV